MSTTTSSGSPVRRAFRSGGVLFSVVLLAGCANLMPRDPLNVTVAGIEPLAGEGLELRMLVKLRVQNPNDTPIAYDGVALDLDVLDKSFATGVSAQTGTVPRFGESVIEVPVTISMFRMARQALGMLDGRPMERVPYEMSGKLSGSAFSTARFSTAGEIDLRTLRTPSGRSGK